MSTYDLITDSIISILEAGEIPPWQREWNANSCIPRNAVTGTSYSGINVINLQLHGMHHGYKTNEWATMRQWATLGASVKGQKGTLGVFFKKVQGVDDSGEEYGFNVAKKFYLFNADQADGYEASQEAADAMKERTIENIGQAHELPNSMGVLLTPGEPSYHPVLDRIAMPAATKFTTDEAYFSTMAHEACHATGHKTRLDRKLSTRFGDNAYAMEELIAELGAVYICASMNIPYRLENHVSYLNSWLKVMRSDRKAIFTAAAAAQRASDFIGAAISSHRLINEQESELGALLYG